MRSKRQLPWFTISVARLTQEFNTNLEKGLSPERIPELFEKYGPNKLQAEKEIGIFEKLVKQLKSPLVFILLAAGFVTLFLQAFIDTTVIFIAVFINVVVGVFQEERASKAFEKLAESQEKNAVVVRGGKRIIIPAENLVPGDLVIIESGYSVPADIRITKEKGLMINEAALTGEWVAVAKDTKLPRQRAPITEQFNMAWMGTLVASGYGEGVVVATGENTQVGIIARHLGRVKERATPLQQSIKKLARFLVYIIGAAILFIFLLGLYRGEALGSLLLTSVAIAVATMPSGLPAAVSIVLALGMESILKKGGLVRNLLAAETLGATTIILTDKTGTLTVGKMKLAELHSLASLKAKVSKEPKEIPDDRELLKAAVLTSSAFIEEGEDAPKKLTVHGSPIEKAIVLEGLEHGISQIELEEKNKRIDFLYFESSRRFGVSLNELPKGKLKRLYIKGAPETLLENSTHVLYSGKKIKMTDEKREMFIIAQQHRSREGMRLIGVAYRDVSFEMLPNASDEEKCKEIATGLTFVGLVAFNDPPRDDVGQAIATVKRAGARVVMLTGDNPETARKIAIDVGIASEFDSVLLGEDIEHYDDEALFEAIKTTPVFARVLPEQKLRIVRILRNKEEVVAMTGDGINDAPALRAANIGIAVGSGTEVAKEAADIVLLNNSFSIIVDAIREGRKIIDNLKKIVAYLLSTSFSEIFIIGGALIAGAPIPLLPSQILWANIIEEGLMSFAFAFEKPEEGIMKRDPRSSATKNILTRELKLLILIIGTITGIFLIGLYFFLLKLELPIDEIRTIMFAALSLDSIFFAFSLKSFRKPIWKVNFLSNWYLIFALGVSILLLFAALTLAPLQLLLTLTPLSNLELLLLLGIGIFNLFLIETVKYFLFERRLKK